MRRHFFIGFALIIALLALLVPALAGANTPVSGAAFTTVNETVDGTATARMATRTSTVTSTMARSSSG
jgi:hypothetical protein